MVQYLLFTIKSQKAALHSEFRVKKQEGVWGRLAQGRLQVGCVDIGGSNPEPFGAESGPTPSIHTDTVVRPSPLSLLTSQFTVNTADDETTAYFLSSHKPQPQILVFNN